MSFIRTRRLILVALLAQACVVAGARAQSASDSATSVADAAKKAREQKKTARVITDDDMDAKNVKPGEEGLTVPTPRSDAVPPSPAAVAAAEAADQKAAQSPADDPLKKGDPPKVKKLKEELAQAEEDLKLSQRESSLEEDTVYSKPDYQHDTAGLARLSELQQQINEKQQKVDAVKARLAALQEELSHAGPGAAGAAPAEEQPAGPPRS